MRGLKNLFKFDEDRKLNFGFIYIFLSLTPEKMRLANAERCFPYRSAGTKYFKDENTSYIK